MLVGLSRYLFIALCVASAYLIYALCGKLGFNSAVGLSCAVLLIFDTLYFNTYRFLLLDPVAVFFALLSLCLYLAGKLYLSAVSIGLATASKLSSMPVVLGLLCFAYRDRGFKGTLKYVLVAAFTYLLTYVVDLSLGLNTVIEHHVDMFKYMSWRHGFSLPIALNGFSKLLARVEYWRYLGELTIAVNSIVDNGFEVSSAFTPLNKSYVVVGVGLGSVLWYAVFPALLYTTYTLLVKPSEKKLHVPVLFSWLSLINAVAGPIDWYYANVLPYLYLNLCAALYLVLGNRFKVAALTTTALQATLFTLTVTGLVPYRIVITW